jgi:AraC-like DNA-binding protein
MEKCPTQQFRKISPFDSTSIQSAYPGLSTLQLEPGSVDGWIRAVTVDQLKVTSGTLNRATLYEGTYTKGMINLGFILDPDSAAVVQGHAYEAGAISIDVGEVSMHEAYPANMVWTGINVPEALAFKEFGKHQELLRARRHLTLKGQREELKPLIQLTEYVMKEQPDIRGAEAKRLSALLLSAIRKLVLDRFADAVHDLPYAEGDRFLMRLVKMSHQLSQERSHESLRVDDICTFTGIKRRTLQKYFKILYGMGPTEYFRVRRLNGARNDLLLADASTGRVGEIAEHWGFSHLGRFSVKYRNMFSESPRSTLNRTRVP